MVLPCWEEVLLDRIVAEDRHRDQQEATCRVVVQTQAEVDYTWVEELLQTQAEGREENPSWLAGDLEWESETDL